jgi:23S rRNA (cytosine1962-C5)-methyltransferase
VIADALLAATGCTRLYERSDAGVRQLEGLPSAPAGCAATAGHRGDDHRTRLALTLDVAQGHKTGFYLDQRDNRAASRAGCASWAASAC